MKILGLVSAVIGCLAFGYMLAYISHYWKNLSTGGRIVSIIIEIITLLLLFLGIYVYKL